jgi:hypothetical protein
MKSQQMMELLLAMQEEARRNQTKAETGHKELLAKLEADRETKMKAW